MTLVAIAKLESLAAVTQVRPRSHQAVCNYPLTRVSLLMSSEIKTSVP
jgi:hypothetical protein